MPRPPPGNLPDPGIEPTSSTFPELQVDYSLVAPTVKHLLAMWETWIPSLGGEDPLEEGMATHSSVLAWGIPMDRGTWWASVHGVAKRQTRLSNLAQTAFFCCLITTIL